MQPQSLDYLTAQSRCVGVKKKKRKTFKSKKEKSIVGTFLHCVFHICREAAQENYANINVGKVHFNGRHLKKFN